MDIVDIVQIHRTGIELVARTRIHVVAKWDRDQFYREVYRIETLLHITCQIISESKHPRFCFPRFVSIWPAPEVVDGIFEVCTAATKFCPLVNKPVALGFSLWWRFFDLGKHFCPLVRLGLRLNLMLKSILGMVAIAKSLPEFVRWKSVIADLCLVRPQVFPFGKNFAKRQNIKDAVVLWWGRPIFEKSSQTMGITAPTVNSCQRYTKNDTRGKFNSSLRTLFMNGVGFVLALCSHMNSHDPCETFLTQ